MENLFQLTDKNADLALLKIQGTGFKKVKVGNDMEISRQEEVWVFGFPFSKSIGASLMASKGFITSIPMNGEKRVFITDATVNPGNSGGPLVNHKGEVVGIIISKLLVKDSGFTVSEGINFALPIRYVFPLLLGYVPDFDFLEIGKGIENLSPKDIDQLLEASIVLIKTYTSPFTPSIRDISPPNSTRQNPSFSEPGDVSLPKEEWPLPEFPENRTKDGELEKTRTKILFTIPPVYPRIARESGWEGTVLVRVLVQTDGRPGSVRVRKSSGHAILDDAAIETVKKWRFIPAKDGNIPIRSVVEIPIHFALRK